MLIISSISIIMVSVATLLVFGLLSELAIAAQVLASVVQVVCTVDLVVITYWHMEESRRLRMKEFHSQMLENVLRPLLEIVNEPGEGIEYRTCIENKLKEKLNIEKISFEALWGVFTIMYPKLAMLIKIMISWSGGCSSWAVRRRRSYAKKYPHFGRK